MSGREGNQTNKRFPVGKSIFGQHPVTQNNDTSESSVTSSNNIEDSSESLTEEEESQDDSPERDIQLYFQGRPASPAHYRSNKISSGVLL